MTNNQGILRKTVPLSGEHDPICPNSIFLDAEKTTMFGRTSSSDTNVRLLSRKTPLMISRKHASIAFGDGKWTIVDHNSMNGVFVNGKEISPDVCTEIKPGDRICFGVAVDNNVHEFDYMFEIASCATRKRKPECWEVGQQDQEAKVRKVLRESSKNNKNEPGTSKDCEENFSLAIQESEKKIEALNLLLAEKETAYQMQIEEKEKDLAVQLLEQKEILEQEKHEQEKYLMELLNDKVQNKEKDLNNQLEQQKAILLAEKVKVENDLLQELDRKLEEKDKELTEQLEAQRDRLENVLQLKVNEQIQLQEELNRNKIEREKLLGLQENEKRLEESLEMLKGQLEEKQELLMKQQEVTRKAEEMAERVLVEQMEDEFTCSICHELFIEATTLACCHTFCNFCLKSWLKRKKLCPICRTEVDVKGTFVRSIVLDSAVEKIVGTMDNETKERRHDLSRERKRLIETTQVEDNPLYPPRPVAGINEHNPIVVPPGSIQDDDVQVIERHPPPPYTMQMVPAARVPAHHGERVARRPRRPHGAAVHPYRAHHNHCYVCGMRGHIARACPFAHAHR